MTPWQTGTVRLYLPQAACYLLIQTTPRKVACVLHDSSTDRTRLAQFSSFRPITLCTCQCGPINHGPVICMPISPSCLPTRLTSQLYVEVSSPMYLYHGAHSFMLPLECGRLRLRRVPALCHVERATEWRLSREHKTLDQLCNPRALNPPSRGAQTNVPAQQEA
jgi:hypothetical protein